MTSEDKTEDKVNLGKVKFYDIKRGFGFIYPEGGKKEIFLHKTELEKSGYKDLNVDASVSYEIYTDVKGKSQAVKVKLI